MHLAIVFFSATNNTRTMAEIIKDRFVDLNTKIDLFDVTTEEARINNLDISAYDAAVFGFPVHSLRAPKLVRQWLGTLNGNGMKCSMFFTYGGFMVHPSHFSTAEILKKRNFIVVSSAEFPGKHTYNLAGWNAFPDRPDKREFELAKIYVEATYRRFTGEDTNILSRLDQSIFSEEQLDHFEKLRYKIISTLPTRSGQDCCMCGMCEKLCPTQAMDHILGVANPELCIACLRCVAICPDEALKTNDTRPSWNSKLSMSNTSEIQLNSQNGKIYL